MDFRDAKIEDIKQMHLVRNSVKENKLSDPNLISEDDYKEFLTKKEKVGFAKSKIKSLLLRL